MFKEEQQKEVKETDQPIRLAPQIVEGQSAASSFIFGNTREWEVELGAGQPHQIPFDD